MSNDAYIPEFQDDQQQALQDMELFYFEQQMKQEAEHQQYLEVLAKGDDYGK